ncbi:hypothetical protein GGQ87_002031 [Brevundimonas alba]|uniref:Uncharacterized protein n=1 Tax=Brevundimonas alba TaxID=74314 RepID=A0A7X5YL69_9CAUL|nr:hypothetical protein [Brevundimonas alba]NJC41773.1 hypothetical protein [Brevundimonas alba]
MLTVYALALALTAAPQVVQVPVEAPRLSEGPLAYAGPFGGNRLYLDAASWERSDLPGLVGGTVVIITPDDAVPVQVMRAWIDCGRRVYQLSPGRAYNTEGVEFAGTSFLPDQPVGSEGPMKDLSDRVCGASFDLETLATTPDWRVALDEVRSAAPGG